jgi:hypothetical protein
MYKKFCCFDIIVLIFLAFFCLLYAFTCINFSIYPSEDAAIVLRYSDNFAQGHGIVWNIGDKPVDGATDFLFMVLIGLFLKAGLSLEFAARFIGISSHILTVFVTYICLRKLWSINIIPAVVVSVYLAVSPGLYYVAAYFGTPLFTLLVSITWYTALTIKNNGSTHKNSILFASAALMMSLCRPEGLILSLLMLLALVYLRKFKNVRLTILYFSVSFIIIGGIYCLWRWNYFGYPLSNPFYKKGGLYLSSLKNSIENVTKLCLPFLPAFLFGFYSITTRRLTVGFLIPVIGFTASFLFLSEEMNFGARYQYPVLPVVLMSFWPLVEPVRKDLQIRWLKELDKRKLITLNVFLAVFSIGILVYQYNYSSIAEYYKDGNYEVAVILSDYKNYNCTIATSESGLLSLYSGWKVIDTWGLNDRWIAHNDGLTEEYLGRSNPQVISFHNLFYPGLQINERLNKWLNMVSIMKNYAEQNGYILAAVYGISLYDSYFFYVKSDFPQSKEIVDKIRNVNFSWYESGERAVNYALFYEHHYSKTPVGWER